MCLMFLFFFKAKRKIQLMFIIFTGEYELRLNYFGGLK